MSDDWLSMRVQPVLPVEERAAELEPAGRVAPGLRRVSHVRRGEGAARALPLEARQVLQCTSLAYTLTSYSRLPRVPSPLPSRSIHCDLMRL